ncbi:MAG: Rieske (2Fe-2S) protein [Vicinamibacterales bacterium]
MPDPAGGADGRPAWTLVARLADLEGRDVIGVEAGGRPLALYRLGGEVFVTDDRCPHQGAALSSGCVVEGYIECPVHHALFDIRTGAADGSVTAVPLTCVPARVEHDAIYVDLSGMKETPR